MANLAEVFYSLATPSDKKGLKISSPKPPEILQQS
jgi:hypothetical protein